MAMEGIVAALMVVDILLRLVRYKKVGRVSKSEFSGSSRFCSTCSCWCSTSSFWPSSSASNERLSSSFDFEDDLVELMLIFLRYSIQVVRLLRFFRRAKRRLETHNVSNSIEIEDVSRRNSFSSQSRKNTESEVSATLN
jgi:hypothetical protein